MPAFKYFFKFGKNADLMSVILVILTSLSGLGIGYLLALISPEEMKPGKNYFLIMEKVLRVLVFVPALFFGAVYDSWFILLLVVLAVSFLLKFRGRLVLLYLAFILMIFLTRES